MRGLIEFFLPHNRLIYAFYKKRTKVIFIDNMFDNNIKFMSSNTCVLLLKKFWFFWRVLFSVQIQAFECIISLVKQPKIHRSAYYFTCKLLPMKVLAMMVANISNLYHCSI